MQPGKGNQGGGNSRRHSWRSWRFMPAALAAVMGLALTFVVVHVVARLERDRTAAEFRRGADERAASIRHHMEEVFQALQTVRGLYYASNEVEPGEFHEFVTPLVERTGSLRAMLWAPRKGEAFPVTYSESSGDRAHPVGLDLGANGAYRQAIEQASDSGQAVCTARVRANDKGEHDVLIFLPVYARPTQTAPATPARRRERLTGLLAAVVSPRGVLWESVKPLAVAGLRLRLYDLSAPPGERFLHGLARTQEDPEEAKETPVADAGLNDRRELSVGGRRWQLDVTPTEAFIRDHRSVAGWIVAACGVYITGLVAAYILVLLGQARRIRTEVEARTVELRREIANREKVEQALNLQKAQAQQYLDVAGVILVLLDHSGRVVLINRMGCDVLGRSEGEILGVDWFEAFVPAGDREALRADFARRVAAQTDAANPFEYAVLDFAGRRRTISWRHVLVRDDQGNVVGTLSSGSDVTERRQMEAQILHAQKLESLGILAGGIAHDFNNILTAVLGHADLALRELAPVSPARGNLHEIATAARRAADLCRQLLAYSGKGRFVVEPIDLSALIGEMTHLIEVSISKKVSLRRHFAPNLPAVDGDATQLRQIVMNLITNASEAIGEAGGEILVTTDSMVCDEAYLQSAQITDRLPAGRYVTIEVSDDGCGMDAGLLERIFDPFFSTKFAGRGLGLAAVLGIVRGHKGGVKVYSEPGQGTTFKVFLPASVSQPRPPESPRDADAQWRGQGTVLIVDDEECVRTLGREMLTRMGFSVLLAEDGRGGLEVFARERERIVCVVLDLTMPKMDGEEAFRLLRAACPDVRVILCSGYNEQDVTQRFVGKGLAGFIQKPFEYATLAARLREALEG